MARIARVVIPGVPHHITQRGNRRQQTFFCDADFRHYINLLCELRDDAGVQIWAYCLMPNHVHIVAVPEQIDSLAKLFRPVHQRFSRYINARFGWRGHLWQERFYSSAMDEAYTFTAVRYVELNPVRAGLCARPEDWVFSSANAHLSGRDDRLVTVAPMLNRVNDWNGYLALGQSAETDEIIRRHGRTGRPLGSDQFLERLEQLTGRSLRPRKRGRSAGKSVTQVLGK